MKTKQTLSIEQLAALLQGNSKQRIQGLKIAKAQSKQNKKIFQKKKQYA